MVFLLNTELQRHRVYSVTYIKLKNNLCVSVPLCSIQPLHLLDGVISVARPLIHLVWNQQSHLFVVT